MGLRSLFYQSKFSVKIARNIFCYYCSVILFLRSFFLVERPQFFTWLLAIYYVAFLTLNLTQAQAELLFFKVFFAVGLYLISIDTVGSKISSYILCQKEEHFLRVFFQSAVTNSLKEKYLRAGWDALFIGKTPMTATGRASLGVGLIGLGGLMLNSYFQRAHERTQSSTNRAHEVARDEKARAYQNYTYARNKYDNAYFPKGPQPTWSEDNYTQWRNSS